VTGCMTLETLNSKIWDLNAIAKPDYVSNNYPFLICSLIHNSCVWAHSPLDYAQSWMNATYAANAANSGRFLGRLRRQSTPQCEKLPKREVDNPVDTMAEDADVSHNGHFKRVSIPWLRPPLASEASVHMFLRRE
jgi:hypothetical protein